LLPHISCKRINPIEDQSVTLLFFLGLALLLLLCRLLMSGRGLRWRHFLPFQRLSPL
jgi:hypothetical protein